MRSARNKHLIAISGNQRVFSVGARKQLQAPGRNPIKGRQKSRAKAALLWKRKSGASRSERVINTRQQENGKHGREITAAH
jgi:hypothetical protein